MAAASRRVIPARNISLWLTISALEVNSFNVEIKKRLARDCPDILALVPVVWMVTAS